MPEPWEKKWEEPAAESKRLMEEAARSACGPPIPYAKTLRIVLFCSVVFFVGATPYWLAYHEDVWRYEDLSQRMNAGHLKVVRDTLDAVGGPSLGMDGASPEYLAQVLGQWPMMDPWGRAYQVDLSDGRLVIYSFGRDGLPGGRTADADLSTANLVPVERHMTFTDFFAHPYARYTHMLAGMSAFMVGVVVWTLAQPQRMFWWAIPYRVLEIGGLSFVFWIVAVFLSQFDAPSGH